MITIPASKIVQAYLILGESGAIFTSPSSTSTWPLFVSSLPDGPSVPNECGCVYDTTPVSDGREMETGNSIEHYGIQLRIRAPRYEDGYMQIASAYEILSSVRMQSISVDTTNFIIHCFSMFSGIIPMGAEPGTTKRRDEFTLNFRTAISLEE